MGGAGFSDPYPYYLGTRLTTDMMAEALPDVSPVADAVGSHGGAPMESKPTCIVCLGMAGSGKTTFVQRLTAHLHAKKAPPYVINLDPAVHEVPYPVNIDIRDTVNYKEVMRQYNLGPNGGIVTSLNLFATKFNEVMRYIDKNSHACKYVIFDTPGQIEVFTWSASGAIITEALASSFPTIVVYVMDTIRSRSPVTFMSNMLYACSIFYKTKLPLIVAMNKTDVVDNKFAVDWMKDFELFDEALDQESSYQSCLSRSMSLVLDQFYENLATVGVSSLLGLGFEEFVKATVDARAEYLTQYYPELEKLRLKKQERELKRQEEQLAQLKLDQGEGKEVPLTSQSSAPQSKTPAMEILLGGERSDNSDASSDMDG